MRDCGGCHGKGSHWRWCPKKVGQRAHRWGTLSQEAENLADSIGGNDPGAANHCYAAAGILRAKADEAVLQFQEGGYR